MISSTSPGNEQIYIVAYFNENVQFFYIKKKIFIVDYKNNETYWKLKLEDYIAEQ